jgi:hypothetical protein
LGLSATNENTKRVPRTKGSPVGADEPLFCEPELWSRWIEPESRDVRFPGLTAELGKTSRFSGWHVHFAIFEIKMPVCRGSQSFQELPDVSPARHNPV